MEEKNVLYDGEIGINVTIVVREEKMEEKKVFIVSNDELGVADFGETLDEAIGNFKKSMRLYLDTYPEKKELLVEDEPLLISRIFL